MRKKFRRAFIEITNKCNLRCEFCAPAAPSARFMTLEEFEAAAVQVHPLAEMVSLHVLGEPFMHPRLPEMLAVCSRLAIKINLVTNGTLLDTFGAALFEEKCLSQVSVSLHALAGLTEDRRRKTLEKFVRFTGSKPARLIVGFRLRGKKGDSFVKATRDHLLNFFGIEGGGLLSASPRNGQKSRGIKLRENVFLNEGEMFEWPRTLDYRDSKSGVNPAAQEREDSRNKRDGCLGLRHHFAILCSGEVVPCCADYSGVLSLGNIRTTPLADILSSDAAATLRDSIAAIAPMPLYCSACGFR